MIKVPKEAFVTPKSAVAGTPTKARATQAKAALEQKLAVQRQRLTADIRPSDDISGLTVMDIGAKGWGLAASFQRWNAVGPAIEEATRYLGQLGFGDVALVVAPDRVQPRMQVPRPIYFP